MESIKVKALPLEMDRLYERENVEVEMCRLCFTLALSQQAVTNSPFSQEFNNFKFIEAQTGFDLPANVCGQCLVQLNQLGSFLKMCKDAFNTYKLMKSNAPNIQPSPQITSDVDIIKQEAIDSESDENIFETSIDIADESEKLFTKFSDQEEFFETLTQSQTPKTELDCDDTSDPFYCDDTDMEENMNKESTSQIKTCPTCGVNVSTLFSHYSKNPKCGPRNSHCSTCNLYFGNKHRLLHHQKTHHPDEVSTTSLMCHVCSKTFQYAESLSQHLRTHENDQQDVCDQSGNVMDDEEVQCTPSQLRGGAKGTVVPKKSKETYEKEYKKFLTWCSENNDQTVTESVVITYFEMLSKTKKSSTLWTTYSMLRTMLSVRQSIDISKYIKLSVLLKRLSEGYEPKKSKILEPDDIDRFINEAPDEMYLAMKIVLIMGYCGACRREELTNMLIDDVEFKTDTILVSLTKTKRNVSRLFAVTDLHWIDLIKKYANARPAHASNRRFFLTYHSGRCTTQPIGINRIGQIPKLIATFLKLPNPQLFSGHCFRRSSTSHLANRGGDLMTIKRHRGWKSSAAAEGYIEASLKKKIQGTTQSEASTSATSASASVNENLMQQYQSQFYRRKEY